MCIWIHQGYPITNISITDENYKRFPKIQSVDSRQFTIRVSYINANLLLFYGRTIRQLENVIFIALNLFITEPSVLSKITVFFSYSIFNTFPESILCAEDGKDGPHPLIHIIFFIYWHFIISSFFTKQNCLSFCRNVCSDHIGWVLNNISMLYVYTIYAYHSILSNKKKMRKKIEWAISTMLCQCSQRTKRIFPHVIETIRKRQRKM